MTPPPDGGCPLGPAWLVSGLVNDAFGDIVEFERFNAQSFKKLQEEDRPEGSSPDLGGKRHAVELEPVPFTHQIGQLDEVDFTFVHQPPDVAHQILAPLLFGQIDGQRTVPEILEMVRPGLYPVPNTLAQTERNRYKQDIKNDARRAMDPNFLKSAAARSLADYDVSRWSEARAYKEFRRLRWPETKGEPVCPKCGHKRCYEYKTRPLFKCASCRKCFSVTSGTIFAGRKAKFGKYLAAIIYWLNCVKGNPALQMSRQLNLSYRACFVMAHKFREAIQADRKAIVLSGEVEIDGAYFGGHIRPPNKGRAGQKGGAKNKSKKQCVLAMVQRGGATVPLIVRSENRIDVMNAVDKHVADDSVLFADEHGAYDTLHAWFEVYRVNHGEIFADGKACTNSAETYFKRMRQAEIGQYHHISGKFLEQYAFEIAYRSDRRRTPNGTMFREVGQLCLGSPVSRVWKGYWQGRFVSSLLPQSTP